MSRKVTVYINDNSMYLLVSQGAIVKKWASATLEPDLVRGAVVQQPDVVASRLKELMEETGISGGKVNICMSGLDTLTRPLSLPRVSAKVLPEVLLNEARQAMPVPLDKYYLSWQILETLSDRIDVFVAAISRQTADALLATVRAAGLAPAWLDLKPLALTRATPEATAIIVDVQSSEFDIIIKSGGIPQPQRTLPLDEDELSLADKLPLIRDDILRTIQFYNDNNLENTLDKQVPLYVSGELAARSELMETLSRDTGYEVKKLPAPLDYPPEFDPNLYTGGVAVVDGSKLPPSETKTALNLNVLPPAYLPKTISIARVLALPVLAVAVVLLGFMSMLYFSLADAVTTMDAQLENTNKLLLERKLEAKRLSKDITALEGETATILTRLEEIDDMATSFARQHTISNNNLSFALDYLPHDVYLGGISLTENTMTLSGWGENEDTIIYYGNLIDNAIPASEVIVSSLVRRTSETMGDFILLLRTRE
jgi:Tfp pilus assembly PilM family ATPase